jgi:hypothetical protein
VVDGLKDSQPLGGHIVCVLPQATGARHLDGAIGRGHGNDVNDFRHGSAAGVRALNQGFHVTSPIDDTDLQPRYGRASERVIGSQRKLVDIACGASHEDAPASCRRDDCRRIQRLDLP